MKTQFIFAATLFLGIGFGASAQNKTGSECPPQSSENAVVQPYGIEESESDFNNNSEIMLESDPNLKSGRELNNNSSGNFQESENLIREEELNSEEEMESRSKAGEAISNTGSTTKSAVSKTGSAVKSGGKTVGKGVKKVGKTVGKGAKKTGKAVGNTAEHGWQEVKEHTPGTDTREAHKEGLVD